MVVGRIDVLLGATFSRSLLALTLAGGIVACAGRSEQDGADHGVGGAGETGTGGSSSGTAGASASGGSGGSAGKGGSGGSAGTGGAGGSAGKVDCTALSAASEAALNEARQCDPTAAEPECTLRVTVGAVCGEDQFVNAAASEAVAVMKQADAQYAESCVAMGVTCGPSRVALGANCTAEGLCETVYDNGGRGCRVDGTLYPHGAMHINPSFDCPDCQCDDGALVCPDVGGCAACPDGTMLGRGCAICGPTDACLATEIGCFPSCTTGRDCGANALCSGRACVTGICG